MSESLYITFDDLFPKPRKVCDVGWEGLLNNWSNETVDCIKREVLSSGLEPSSKSMERLIKELEIHGVHLPSEIFSGGMFYPPKNDKYNSEVEHRLELIRDAIKKINKFIPGWPKTFSWEVLLNNGLNYTGATHESIKATENRLDVSLPESYKNFLMVSNGCLTNQEIFLPDTDIDWLNNKDPDLVIDWCGSLEFNPPKEDHFKYDIDKEIIPDHVKYIPKCLLISENYGSSSRYYLLNSAVVFKDGEWEAWSLEPRISGAARFRSFEAMMEWLYVDSIHALRSSAYKPIA